LTEPHFLCLQEYKQPEREADNSVTTSTQGLSTKTRAIHTLELLSKRDLRQYANLTHYNKLHVTLNSHYRE